MITRLQPDQFARVRPLFAEFDNDLLCTAALTGISPATVLVDNAESPRAAFLIGGEGSYAAGITDNSTYNAALPGALREALPGAAWIFLHAGEAWAAQIRQIVTDRPWFAEQRLYFELEAPRLDWRVRLPDGFTMRTVDATLLDDDSLRNVTLLRDWIAQDWGSREMFFQHGFGCCIVNQGVIASWSLTDTVVGDRCEIGIETDLAYRRRGLAATVVAAVIEVALVRGIQRIGWHCWAENSGSIGVARAAGLVQRADYLLHSAPAQMRYYYGLRANNALNAGNPNAAREWIESSLALPDVPDWVYLHAARLHAQTGEAHSALERLRQAIVAGWSDRDVLRNHPDFAPLRELPDWPDLLASIVDRT